MEMEKGDGFNLIRNGYVAFNLPKVHDFSPDTTLAT